LVLHPPAAGDLAGIAAQEEAEVVFLLPDAPFQVWQGDRGGADQRLGLILLEPAGDPALAAGLDQAERGLAGLLRPAGDFQLQVQLPQVEVGSAHLAHQE